MGKPRNSAPGSKPPSEPRSDRLPSSPCLMVGNTSKEADPVLNPKPYLNPKEPPFFGCLIDDFLIYVLKKVEVGSWTPKVCRIIAFYGYWAISFFVLKAPFPPRSWVRLEVLIRALGLFRGAFWDPRPEDSNLWISELGLLKH